MMYAFTGTEAPSRWYSIVISYLSPEQEDELHRGREPQPGGLRHLLQLVAEQTWHGFV